MTRRHFKTHPWEGEAPAEPCFSAVSARRERRPPGFETASKQLLVVALFSALSTFAACGFAFAAEENQKSVRPSIGHPVEVYGEVLPIVKDMGVGPTMAARVVDQTLYSIGRGKLHVFDIADPADPKPLGELDGLGATRQIEVENQVAYITSREDGVFIVDVSGPDEPRLLCHYDPIEVATGMDVSGDVMFVACRSHGVELVDISDPEKPRHLSTARTGEAQSVEVRNGFAYVGVWGSRELVVVDVRNARKPMITARLPLDGNGDGVTVRGEYVYVATGHHSRVRRKSYPAPGDPGFGHGHGLEIFRITDPVKPEFVSRIKTPPFYRIGNDMWGVKIAGNYAFVHDTHNGIFVVDISDPEQPSFVAHRQLDYADVRMPKYMGAGALPGFVGGLALGDGFVYVAGGWTDLHVVAAPGLAAPCRREPDAPPEIPAFQPELNERFQVYRPEGQVRAVAMLDDMAVVAAGSAGICVVRLSPEPVELGRYPTQGFAMEVKTRGDLVYVAEEKGGLSIWRHTGGGVLSPVGRYAPRGQIVKDVVVPAPGKYAVLQVDMSTLDIVDVSDPVEPKRVFRDKGHGFVYHLGQDLFDGRRICVLFQLGGLRWYDLYGEAQPSFAGLEYAHRLGGAGSIPLGNKRLVVHRNGLLLVAPDERRPPAEVGVLPIPNQRLRGKPVLNGNKLYLSDRCFGDIHIVDISDIEKPALVEHFNVPGNPARLILNNGALVIPNGYEGLWIERKQDLDD